MNANADEAEANEADELVIGPNGDVLTREALPPTKDIRWVARRKAEIVIAVNSGLLTLTEVSGRYAIAPEEFFCWKTDYESRGLMALQQSAVSRSTPRQG